MPRYQMDDGMDSDLRVVQAGTAAFGLYARCGVWVSRNLTDGFVPAEIAALYGTREWIERLTATGLWRVVEGGFTMPSYLDDNPSADKVRKERAMKADRQARWLEKARNPSSNQRRVSRPSNSASKGASRDALEDDAPPLPSPKGEGVGGAPLRRGAPPPTRQPPAPAADPPTRSNPPGFDDKSAHQRARRVLAELDPDDAALALAEAARLLNAEGYRATVTAQRILAVQLFGARGEPIRKLALGADPDEAYTVASWALRHSPLHRDAALAEAADELDRTDLDAGERARTIHAAEILSRRADADNDKD
jgi:hypothetical protein